MLSSTMVKNTIGDHHFLFAVVTFFSNSKIENIFDDAGKHIPRLPDYKYLDDTERKIIFALIENHQAW